MALDVVGKEITVGSKAAYSFLDSTAFTIGIVEEIKETQRANYFKIYLKDAAGKTQTRTNKEIFVI